MRKTILIISIAMMSLNSFCAENTGIIFPRAFAFAIDDMGWNIGNDCGDMDGKGPYRIGIDRKMDIKDYVAVVEVGKAVGVRIQGLFVLSEMDRENILAKYPTTTWQGENWDNTKNVGPEQIDIMKYVKENAANLEFGLHGVGHEYWVNGEKKRAEWYCQQDNHPWPMESVKEHIQCFKDIMGQYGLSAEKGHSFPESFVPCAYGYYWNPDGDYSTGSVMAEAGVKYVNTLFDYIRELNPPTEPNGGGFDNGVVVVNRINYGNPWWQVSSLPTVDLAEQESDIIETHWSNWLAQDNFLQEATNNRWIEYYKMVQSFHNRYVAKNTEQFHSQWLYKKYSQVIESVNGKVEIDNSKMPKEYYDHNILGNMVLKIKLDEGQHVSIATINKEPIACYFEEAGFGFIYLPQLAQEKYVLEYKVSNEKMPLVVFNDGTYNVYKVTQTKKNTSIKIRIYGQQELKVYCNNPGSVNTDNPDLKITGSKYDALTSLLTLQVAALDIQGETGTINLIY